MTDRPHPRRTKSPLSRPSKHEEGLPVNLPHGQKRSSVHAAGQAVVHYKQNTGSQPNREYSRYTEVMKKTNAGSKYIMDRTAPLDRVGIGERSYPSRSGAIWSSDAARLCLSSRFGTLPQMDFGEPSGKRLKFSASTNREVETAHQQTPVMEHWPTLELRPEVYCTSPYQAYRTCRGEIPQPHSQISATGPQTRAPKAKSTK
ncbi:hypothetical protein ILYODFUR_016092, partial [Ilyodon furcidens]